jgi:glycosyltransferase involved in cell wall biosynthesis
LITVAICTRNRAAFLDKAIRSMLPQLTPDTELLVVDNSSTDDTHLVCERWTGERVWSVICSKPGLA